MKTYTVSLFGHRHLSNPLRIEKQLEQLVIDLLEGHTYVEFLIGRDGEFDLLAASVIHRCKRVFRDNCSLIWVMPYLTAQYRKNEDTFKAFYDEIEVCEDAYRCHFKAAFQIRNRCMIGRSDIAVFCIDHQGGGVWQTLNYAKQMGVPYIYL